MIASAACGGIGSILYVAAGLFPDHGFALWFVFMGRFVQGMWTGGAQAIQTVYLASVLPARELTATIVTLRAYASLGFILGPVFGLALNFIPLSSDDKLTAPGFFVLISAIGVGVLFLTAFNEEEDRCGTSESSGFSSTNRDVLEPMESEPLLPDNQEKDATGAMSDERGASRDVAKALLLCNLNIFALFSGFVIQETITTPLVETYYNWTVSSANLLFFEAGVCSLLSFIAVRRLSRVVSDRKMVAWSLSMAVLGSVLLISTPSKRLPAWRFLLGFFTISVAFPVGRGTTMALYTKLLPQKLQGPGQGVILAVGAIARILGPFWAVCSLTLPHGSLLVFGFLSSLFALCLCLVVSQYHTLLKKQPGYLFAEGLSES